MAPRITASDMHGVMAYPPTPALPGAESADARDTVDLAETERMIRTLIADGADAIALNGTLGECASLMLDEWKAFASCVSETVRDASPGFPVFIGSTTLNTRDTIERMRFLASIGIPGTLLGRPMWGEMTAPVMTRFYRDVAEAVPDMAICVYDNTAAFRGIIPRPVYQAMTEIPQVVAVKYAGGASTGFRFHNDLAVVGTAFPLMLIETDWYPAWAMYGPEYAPMTWSSTTACGPAPVLALRDALASGREDDARWVSDRLRWAHEPFLVGQDFTEFAKYNVPLEKIRVNAAGYLNVGRCRPPYTEDLVPRQHVEGALAHIDRYKQVLKEVAERFGDQGRRP